MESRKRVSYKAEGGIWDVSHKKMGVGGNGNGRSLFSSGFICGRCRHRTFYFFKALLLPIIK